MITCEDICGNFFGNFEVNIKPINYDTASESFI